MIASSLSTQACTDEGLSTAVTIACPVLHAFSAIEVLSGLNLRPRRLIAYCFVSGGPVETSERVGNLVRDSAE